MKTFLPIISPSLHPWHSMRLSLEALDNKRLGKQRVESLQIYRVITGRGRTKAWRLAPAVHMWRGYPEALGVYIAINCAVWASRVSNKTGKPFSNLMMAQHIQTYGFGKNEAGELVKWEGEQAIANAANAATHAAGEEKEVAAAAAFASSSTTAATAAPASAAQVASAPLPAPRRSGVYVDGIRIPWWFHDRRVHDSDAGMLYRKDPLFYKSFQPFSHAYPDGYVWPQDIDPCHPEQREELEALKAELEQERKEKEAAKAQKKQQKASKRKRQRSADEEEEEDEPAEHEIDASDEPNSSSTAAAAAAASSSSPSTARAKKRGRTSQLRPSPTAVNQLSPAAAAAAPTAAPRYPKRMATTKRSLQV